ncbi:hypothetical protein [Galbitalea soli]|uniref:hypothetical protein n=1 Tax=Galbitalea soli TaxID=1268042 RepID=UPI0017D05BA5|nr:hypothetical protein [Galbitalea soli]
MTVATNDRALAGILPGRWRVAASNFPMWVDGTRFSPVFSYELLSSDPLVLADDVSYLTAEGVEKHILGVDTFVELDFIWRGRGWQRFVSSRWRIGGFNHDQTIACLHFSRSRVSPAGIDLVVREGVEPPELRRTVAHDAALYGLGPEEFASLAWLDQHAPRPPA